MVIFRRKNICGISTENYVLCSFELEKDSIFRICAIRSIFEITRKEVVSENLRETINLLWLRHAGNFGGKYLGFCWNFVKHIYTHSKGF